MIAMTIIQQAQGFIGFCLMIGGIVGLFYLSGRRW